MTIGLDLGSHQFRSMRVDGDRLVARCCPAVYLTLSDTSAHRRLLQQSNTTFATCSDHLLVIGDAAIEWSAILNLSLSMLLPGGRIPTADPVSRQVLTLVIDSLLPVPQQIGAICKMTTPSGGSNERADNRDRDFFHQLVALRGYRPEFVTATGALALAELQSDGFSGIAISFGHTSSEFGIIHCGREIVRCVVASGLQSCEGIPLLGAGDELDAKMSTNIEREYSRFLTEIVLEARSQFERDGTLKTLPRSLPVVCSGAITATPAFLALFQRVWNEAKWSTSTRPIRVAADANLSVVRGCLIQAILESSSHREAA